MGFWADFMPFHPRKGLDKHGKRPKFDVERALQVQVHAHPTLEQHRAANGDLVLVIQRKAFPGEEFLGRFFDLKRQRRIVLDQYGEFMLTECLKPKTTLADVAPKMARKFDIELDKAKLGVIELVKSLMLRDFVFLVRR